MFLIIITSVLLVIMMLFAALNTSKFQNFLADKIVSTISTKIGTPLQLGHVRIAFPGSIVLEKVYLQDQKADTLLYVDELNVNPSFLALLHHTVNIEDLDLSGTILNLSKQDDKFNFQFIIDSLVASGNKSKQGTRWNFAARDINLNHIRFVLSDSTGGQFIHVKLKKLALQINRLQLDSLHFGINRALADGSNTEIIELNENTSSSVRDSSKTPDVQVKIEKLVVTNSKASYNNKFSGQIARLDLDQFALDKGQFFLLKQYLQADNIKMSNSKARYTIMDEKGNKSSAGNSTEMSKPWRITLKKVQFSRNELQYDDNRFPTQNQHFDPRHIQISQLNMEGENLQYDQGISGDLNSLQFQSSDGFQVHRVSSNFTYQGDHFVIKNGHIQTNNSSIDLNAAVHLSSKNPLQSTGTLDVDANIDPGDLFYFVPQLEKKFPDKGKIRLKADLIRNNDTLKINTLEAGILDNHIFMEGKIGHPGDSVDMAFDIPKIQLSASGKTLITLMPPNTLPEKLRLPQHFEINASIHGSLDALKNRLKVESDYGNLNANVVLHKKPSNAIQLEGKFSPDHFNVGKLLTNQKLGPLDGNFNFSGSFKDVKEANLQWQGEVNHLVYRQYNYQDLHVSGNYDQQKIKASLITDQKDLSFKLKGSANLSAGLSAINVDLDLKNANLKALHFTNNLVAVQGEFKANLDTISRHNINGTMRVLNVNVIKNGKLYHMDSLRLESMDKQHQKLIEIQSDVLQAQINSNIGVPALPRLMSNFFRSYLHGTPSQNTKQEYDSAQFDFSLSLKKPELLTEVIMPKLNRISVTKFKGHFNGVKKELNLDMIIPTLSYGTFNIDSLTLKVDTNTKGIDGNLILQKLQMRGMNLANLQLTAKTDTGQVTLVCRIPRDKKPFFRLATNVLKEKGRYQIHINPDSLLLNGNEWQVKKDNLLLLGSNIWAKNFILQYNGQKINITPKIESSGDTVGQINFQQFQLASIGSIIQGKNPLMAGSVNGHIDWQEATVEGNLDIQHLIFRDDTVGNLSFQAKKKNNRINLDLNLQQNSGKLIIDGSYAYHDKSPLDLRARFNRFAIAGAQPFVQNIFRHLHGYLNGALQIEGSTTKPNVTGKLEMDSLHVFPNYLNTWFDADGQNISFESGKINFDHFEITDAEGNKASLEGTVNTNFLGQYKMDLQFHSDNFRIFNTSAKNNDLYYGKALVSTDTKITGDFSLLHIKTNLTLNEGSEISVIVPQSNSVVIQREGLLQFIDQDKKITPFEQEYKKVHRDTTTQQITGIDLQANIAVHDQSLLRIIIDPDTEERLEVQGNANLAYNLNPNGAMMLSGKYEITRGDYYLNFHQLVKRDFNILKGSYIQWSGNPKEALLNVKARYTVETQPPTGDIAKRLPFYVDLNITGKMLSPDLHFDISMPENQQQEYPQLYSYVQQVNGEESGAQQADSHVGHVQDFHVRK